jgi:hypothetical protein
MPVEREPRWRLLLLLVGIAIALAPTFANGLVYDDTQLIAQSAFIHDARNLPVLLRSPSMVAFNIYTGHANPVDTFRPLTIASFMWDAALSGKDPWSYHLTNLLLHLSCVWLVWRLARLLLSDARRNFAYLTAAWFGLAPLQSEAHVWISGRYDVLSAALALSAILIWRASIAAQREARRLALNLSVAALFLLALLSKEVPLLLLPALLCWPERDERSEPVLARLWRRGLALWPFAVSSALYLAMRLHALQGLRTHRDQGQLSLALSHLPVLLLDGLRQAVAPSKVYLRVLSEEYARLQTWQIALAAGVVVVVAGLAIALRRRLPLLAWGLLWFASLLAPACVVTTLHWPGFGRYLYLASAGLLPGLTWMASELWGRVPRLRAVLAIGGACYGLLCLWTLEHYIATYRSSETLHRNVITERPDLAHGYGMLAAHYATRLENLPEVARLFQLAWQRHPEKVEYAKGWADTLFLLGQLEPMLQVAESAQRRLGPHPEWELIQARALIERDPTRATAHLLRCLQLLPGEPRCLRSIRDLTGDATHGARYRALFALHLERIGPDRRLAVVTELVAGANPP